MSPSIVKRKCKSCKNCIHYDMCVNKFRKAKKDGFYEMLGEEEYFAHADECDFYADKHTNPLAHPESYLDDTMAIVDDMTMAQRKELLKYLENVIERNEYANRKHYYISLSADSELRGKEKEDG